MIHLYLSLLLISFAPKIATTNNLNLELVTYYITHHSATPKMLIDLNGSGSGQIELKVCDNTYGCRSDMPTTIHQNLNQTFLSPGRHQLELTKFSKVNESKKVQITYTDSIGVMKNLNFTIMSSNPKSYNIVSTTLSKVIRESSHLTVSPSNVLTTYYNNFDFRGFYTKTLQDRIINFKDFKVLNGNVYVPLNGYVQILHGFEDSLFVKNGSYYQFNIQSMNIDNNIVPILFNYYYDLRTDKLTNQIGSYTIESKNLIVSKNYDKSKVNSFIFTFTNVGSHLSNIRVTTSLSIRNQIIGSCVSSMICVAKAELKNIEYSKIKEIR